MSQKEVAELLRVPHLLCAAHLWSICWGSVQIWQSVPAPIAGNLSRITTWWFMLLIPWRSLTPGSCSSAVGVQQNPRLEPPRRLSEKNPLNLKSEVLSSHLGQGLLTLCFPDKERDNRRDGGRDRGVKIASRSHLPHHLAHFLEVTLCKGYCCMSSVVAKEHLNAVYWPTVYLLHASLFLYF